MDRTALQYVHTIQQQLALSIQYLGQAVHGHMPYRDLQPLNVGPGSVDALFRLSGGGNCNPLRAQALFTY